MLERLLEILYAERGETTPAGLTELEKEKSFRALCNVRPPKAVTDEFINLQDKYLTEKTRIKQPVDAESLDYRNNMTLWQGDITRLRCGAIVNACNSALLGCFQPLHNCIDNVIHSAAGVQVRLDCNDMMQGGNLPNGEVRVTEGYNLPCRYIFHTVGPQVPAGIPDAQNKSDLKKCYTTCLGKAEQMNLNTIAFCCISTGVYGYPKEDAAELAVRTVNDWLQEHNSSLKVIFNVFLDEDREIYEKELSR